MIVRVVQIFFATSLITSASAQTVPLKVGEAYHFVFRDVDQQQLSIFDGHTTIIAVVIRADQEQEKARASGDRVPDQYIGDTRYRFITVLNFQGKIRAPLRGITSAIVRHRLAQEAKRIQRRYSAVNLSRDPRRDLFVVTDFDGTAVRQLGIALSSAEFAVFLFDGNGRLMRRWDAVPTQTELAEALAKAKPGG